MCFSEYKYPRIHGHPTSGTSRFYVVDIASNGNMAVGGQSTSSTIVSTSSSPNPLVVFYTPTGSITWAKQFQTDKDRVDLIKFSPNGSQLLVALDKSSSRSCLLVLSAADGSATY